MEDRMSEEDIDTIVSQVLPTVADMMDIANLGGYAVVVGAARAFIELDTRAKAKAAAIAAPGVAEYNEDVMDRVFEKTMARIDEELAKAGEVAN